MLNAFETIAGTTAGAKHRRGLLASNQDAVLAHRTERLITGVVADGSSSSPLSHVAAALQVEWFTQLAHEHAASGKPFDESAWDAFAAEIADRIRWNAERSHLPLTKAVRNMWAATVGGVVVGEQFTHIAFFGDGRFFVNGELHIIKEAARVNEQPAPAYPCYLVVPSTIPGELLKFQVFTLPTAEVQHAAVFTDGYDDLAKAQGKLIPGTRDRIPHPSFAWESDALYAKERALSELLNFIGRDWKMPNNVLAGGRLGDDLSITAIRRKKTTEV